MKPVNDGIHRNAELSRTKQTLKKWLWQQSGIVISAPQNQWERYFGDDRSRYMPPLTMYWGSSTHKEAT